MDVEQKDLPYKLQVLIDEIGYDNVIKVVSLLGGRYRYIPKPDKLIKRQMNEKLGKQQGELPYDLQNLIDEIGYDNVIKVAKILGGSHQYIPKIDKLMKRIRDEKIREKFNGYNLDRLAEEYKLSVIQIRNICQSDLKAKKHKQVEGQLSFLEML